MFSALKKLTGSALLAVIAIAPATSDAVVLDFEGVAPVGGSTGANVTPYTEDGFTLTSNGPPHVYHNDIFDAASLSNTNGTSIFGWCGSLCTGAPYTFTLSGAGVFDLASIDFATLGLIAEGALAPAPIDIVGQLFGGGIVSQTIDPSDVWTTFSFSGFSNLVSLQIGAEGPGADLAMDNIVLTSNPASNTVPEPDTVALMLMGVVGLAASRRRAV